MQQAEPRGIFGGEQLPRQQLPSKECADRPHRAKDLSYLGMKAPVPEGLQLMETLKRVDQVKRRFRSVGVYLDLCTKCGACIQACPWYLGTGDPLNVPAARADLLRKVYKRYFTGGGKLFGRLAGGEDITQETLELWYKYFYQCNECRRCAYFCPFGIDTAEITIAARQILTDLGVVPEGIMGVARHLRQYGNNLGIPPKAMYSIVSFMEKELKRKTGKDIPIPIDQEGAEVLHNPSSAEFFITLDTLEGTAKMFWAAGTSWTLSSHIIETANFGLFFDFDTMKEHNNRLFCEARRLKVKRIVAGECGHGWRTWKMFSSQLSEAAALPMVHLQDECLRYMREGRIKLDKSANPEPVTLHDPCNMARACGYVEQPRQVLRAVAEDFREMFPNREKNFCCTGGSGQVTMDELNELKAKAGLVKAQQIKATKAKIVVAPCAICKAELPRVVQRYGLNARIHGLQDIVGFALVL
jgi:Fe-S oxidoreductase